MPADVEAVPRRTAEADVGDLFRNGDFADEVAARRDAVNAVARARPNIAVDTDAEAIRDSGETSASTRPLLSLPSLLAIRTSAVISLFEVYRLRGEFEVLLPARGTV
jgi:hypothetical protein